MLQRPGASVLALFSFALLVICCGGGSTEPPAERASASAPAVKPAEAIGQHMTDHFTRVREIEEAIIRGDIEAARAPARWIAEHQEVTGLPAGSETYVGEMKNAAKAVASTDSIGNAAVAAASVVSTCGTCHSAIKVTPKMPELTAPTHAAGAQSHMREHQYAVDLMYRGLVAPSGELWAKGAQALKAAPLAAQELPKISAEIARFEARVHELADRAINAPDLGAKVAIYGEIVSGCATCHGLHGKAWGPGLPKTE